VNKNNSAALRLPGLTLQNPDASFFALSHSKTSWNLTVLHRVKIVVPEQGAALVRPTAKPRIGRKARPLRSTAIGPHLSDAQKRTASQWTLGILHQRMHPRYHRPTSYQKTHNMRLSTESRRSMLLTRSLPTQPPLQSYSPHPDGC
jgi:hypothetical protein